MGPLHFRCKYKNISVCVQVARCGVGDDLMSLDVHLLSVNDVDAFVKGCAMAQLSAVDVV